jgi:3-phenylpropionate/cinnamic acid dioxygenase small subunit
LTNSRRDLRTQPLLTEFDALRDKQAIAAVCYRYAFALDARDWTALRTCFTADATAYYRDQNATHGYPAIETRIRSALAPLSSTQHLIGNVLVTLAGDEADSVCYLKAQHVRPGTDRGDMFIIAGRYLDRFVRTPDGWQIAQRRFETFWTEGNPAVTAR